MPVRSNFYFLNGFEICDLIPHYFYWLFKDFVVIPYFYALFSLDIYSF